MAKMKEDRGWQVIRWIEGEKRVDVSNKTR